MAKNARKRVERRVRREAERAVRRMPLKAKIALALVLLVAVAAFLLYWNYYVDPLENWFSRYNVSVLAKAEGDMRVHFVDVGQGDSIVVEFPDGKIMVVDGGPRNAKNKVFAYLDALRVSVVDYVVLTHSDEDHVGSLDDIVKRYDVRNIYMPDVSTSTVKTTVYKQFYDAVEKEAAGGGEKLISTDDSDINGGSYLVDFFVDEQSYEKLKKTQNAHTKNAVSPFLFLTYADCKVLLTGDANEESEQPFLQRPEVKLRPEEFDVDVLKVAHHGSDTSSTQEFLELVRPEYAVISCGEGNKYGHPRAETLERLQSVNVEKVYRTDEHGDVVLTLSPDAEGVARPSFSSSKGSDTAALAYVCVTVRVSAAELFGGAYVDGRRRKAA